MIIAGIVLVLALGIVVWGISVYNGLIRLRNTFPAFGDHAVFTCSAQGRSAVFRWECSGYAAVLSIDLGTRSYTVTTEVPA